MCGGGGFFGGVTDALEDIGGGIADLGQGAIDAVSDAGSSLDDAVNEIPGGYLTLAAIAGGVPGLGAEGGGLADLASGIDWTDPSNWDMAGLGDAGMGGGAGGLGDLAGGAIDWTDPSSWDTAGLGDAGMGGAEGGIDWTNPDNWDKAGLGDPGMGGSAPSGLSKFVKGAKDFLGKDTGVGGLTTGGALLGAAGLYKLIDMMKQDNKRFGTPGRQDYTGGALSKFKYDPGSFTPTSVDASKFRPGAGIRTMASGGKTDRPQLTAKAKLAAMDPYNRAIAELNNAAYAARMPQGAKAPATNVSQMGQFQFAGGGISDLGGYSDGGRLLRGPGDGVSDSIPAVIGGKQPARLADGEFVVPARIVSELGNGSTDAGARKLYAMMDRIQKARGATTGKGKVAKNTRADKHLPA